MRASAEERAYARWHDQGMDNEVLMEFQYYQRSQNLATTTIRNRDSLLRGVQRTLGHSLLTATTGELRRHLGRATVTPGTKRTELGALRSFYTFAVDDGYIDESPAERLPAVRVPAGEPRPFSREQIDAMMNSGAYRKTRAMIALGYFQGFRVSQIARTRGDDIDRSERTIRTLAKGGKIGVLPLHPVVAQLATDMPSGWWFPARDGRDRPVRPSSVTDLVTKAKKRAGITDPDLTPHSLRHAYASDLVEAGVDIRVVQELMLHSSLSTTQVYTRVSRERKRAGLERIPGFDLPTRSGRQLGRAA